MLFGSLKRGTKGNQKQRVCEEITAAAGSDRDTSTGAIGSASIQALAAVMMPWMPIEFFFFPHKTELKSNFILNILF